MEITTPFRGAGNFGSDLRDKRSCWLPEFRYARPVFAKPIFSLLLLVVSVAAWLLSAFGGSSGLWGMWPGAFGLAGAAVLGAFTIARGFHGRASLWCVGLATFFFAWIILRGALSEVKYLARPDLVMAVLAFLSYSLVVTQFETTRQRRWILAALLLMLVANAGWAVWQWKTGSTEKLPHGVLAAAFPDLGSWLGWTGSKRGYTTGESTGFFISENHFAGLLELTALPALGFFLMSRAGKMARLAALVCYVMALWGGVLSTSRAGLACLLGGSLFILMIWWLARMRRGQQSVRTTLVVGVVMGVLLVVGMVAASYVLIKRQHGNLVNSDEWTVRASYSGLAWEQWLKRPIDGTGARSFEYEERAQRTLDREKWEWFGDVDTDAVFAHNDWMQLLGDYGAIGGILGLLVVAGHFINGVHFVWHRSKRLAEESGADRRDDRLGLTLGALGALVALAVHSIVDFNLHIGTNAIVAGVLLGLLANPGRESLKMVTDTDGAPLVPRRGIFVRAAMIGLALAGAGFLLLQGPDWFVAERAMQLGERMRAQENYYEGTAALQQAIAKDPLHYPALVTQAFLNVDESERVKENYQPRNAKEQELNEKVRLSFLRAAGELLDKAWKLYPQNPYICMEAGSCYSERRIFDEAELWFSRAFKYGKASRLLYFQYGQHLIRRAVASGDVATQLQLGQRALNEFYLPARAKLRSGGDYQKEIDAQIGTITKWLTDLKAAQSANAPAPAPPSTP